MEAKEAKHTYKIRVPLAWWVDGVRKRAFRIALQREFPRAKVTLVRESPAEQTITVSGFDREIMNRYPDYSDGDGSHSFVGEVCCHVLVMRADLMLIGIVDDDGNPFKSAEHLASELITMTDYLCTGD